MYPKLRKKKHSCFVPKLLLMHRHMKPFYSQCYERDISDAVVKTR